ncbi:gliding motility-associated ABC transporter substrate-binding protein GldG [Taibaiella koreensis]|uniref:gliding motility-associated ABC transporter substrate-binding protein GldG n=1 Tax=Taibaiella koreensis TaxID=1268548 RepID=UPI000E599644|nr:gliding motility-associated ABC transporter substrate-binding protein GldG [Taibaiella koreensis]
MADTVPTVKNTRKQPARRLLVVIAILVAANIAAWFFHAQADLTQDKRYTITAATRHMLTHLDKKIEVLVFLDGDDMPAAFQQLSNSTREMLRQFRDISDNKVAYRVIDPLGNDSTAIGILKEYRMQGIPVNISAGKKGMSQKMIFPWALVTMPGDNGKIIGYPVFLQEVNSMIFNKKILLKSEMLLEYNLANGVHQLTRKERPAIAYVMGNGEQFDPHIGAALVTLQQFYQVDTINLGQLAAIPASFKTILINRPIVPFSEQDKFKIDQYAMNGGNVFWSINMVSGTLDSLQNGHFNAMPLDLNLADLLFHYGVRVNSNLIEDAVSYAYIPVQSGPNAEASMLPWIYFPVLNAGSEHPVVKHLNGVLGRFVSSIDTNTNDPGIRKTVLLASGKYSKTEAAPLPVILQSAIEQPNPAGFPKANLIAAVLLEGTFSSAYAARLPVPVANMIDSLKLTVKAQAVRPGKMIVTGDADILMNEFSEKNGPSEMGFYRFDGSIRYDNKSFLLNSMEYMNDDDNLLAARTKSFDNRILDPKLVEKEKGTWQFINIALPIAAILIFGAVFSFVRKKKYAQ